MNPSKKRDSPAWWMAYSEKQENQGLNLEESVTDGGSGMKKGIKETYENVHEQYDIFHVLMKFTKAENIYENKVYGLINAQYKYEKKLLELSIKEGISLDTLNLFWQQYGINSSKNKYWILDSKLKSSLSNTYCKIKAEAAKILKTIVRCSSIVENINSQIRPYLFLKRVLKGKFLDLLQFYLNTRKYLNSRVEERKGKSPLELLTGKNYGNWLDILGY
jgi:hypothetical protein